jgi:hypothetical protein
MVQWTLGKSNRSGNRQHLQLEGFGLVTRLAPGNNYNLMADFQNRYALLLKGIEFIGFIEGKTGVRLTEHRFSSTIAHLLTTETVRL